MEDNRSRRQRDSEPYTTIVDSPLVIAPDNSIFYASPVSFAPMSHHPVRVPDEYLSYSTGSQLDPTSSYYPAPQPQTYVHQTAYYPTTTLNQAPSGSNTQWLHPSQAASHHHPQTYQDSIPSPDMDPNFDLDLDQGSFSSPSPSYHHTHYQTSPSDPPNTHNHNHNHDRRHTQSPSRTPSTTSASSTHNNTNSKDLSLYGIPSPTHPGAWRCAYPSCTSPSLFRRGCDLRKHYNRHRKHLFCRHDGCPQSNPRVPGAGFSSKKDRDRHEAKHNPGIVCDWAGEGCTRVFSRVDNMKDHVRRIHKGV